MNASDQLAQEMASKGIDGSIELGSDEFYQNINIFMKEFEEFRYSKNLPVYTVFTLAKGMDEEGGYLDELNKNMTGIACTIENVLVGILIIFSIDRYTEELRKQGITRVSAEFMKRSIFGILAHEYFHCRENGKYLEDIVKEQREHPLPHDEDPEEINADLFAISILKQI